MSGLDGYVTFSEESPEIRALGRRIAEELGFDEAEAVESLGQMLRGEGRIVRTGERTEDLDQEEK